MGKTMAAKYFLRKNKTKLLRWIAFCRTEVVGILCVTSILHPLGLHPESPSNGWFTCRIGTLSETSGDDRSLVLILGRLYQQLAELY